ncbi:MAG: hypothetical protein V1807_01205 [Patescibacteria group bacterium]
MASGVTGTGFYGRIRALTDTIKMDKHQLENAPLSPAQKKSLKQRIASYKARLKEVRAELRAWKASQASKP